MNQKIVGTIWWLFVLVAVAGIVSFVVDRSMVTNKDHKGRIGESKIWKTTRKDSTHPLSIVVELSSSLGRDLSRLAFAKMLQAEAQERFRITTKIQLTSKNPSSFPLSCFPRVQQETEWFHDGDFLMEAHRRQQQQRASSSPHFLEPRGDAWDETLLFLLDYSTNTTNVMSDSNDTLSLPFLYLPADNTSPPSLYQYQHLPRVLAFLEFSSSSLSCCRDSSAKNDTLSFERLWYLGEDVKQDLVVLAPSFLSSKGGIENDVMEKNGTVLVVNDASAEAAIQKLGMDHRVTFLTQDPMDQYCYMHSDVPEELVASLESPLAVWAALTSTSPKKSIRFYYFEEENGRDWKSFRLGKGDPRSTIDLVPLKSQQQNETNHSQETSSSSTGARLGTPERPLVIVNQLMGEMANNLAHIAYSYGIKLWLEEDFNITTVILHRHQEQAKWVRARESVVSCFLNLRHLDFSEANTDEFKTRLQQQYEWIGTETAKKKLDVRAKSPQDIAMALDFIRNLVSGKDDSIPAPPPIEENANITLPFISLDVMALYTSINDRYFEELKSFFAFDVDNEACCKERADPDEIAFHVRNYKVEMRRSVSMGFEELSPNKTAHELFRNVKQGDKIAITSRYWNHLQPYVEALQRDRGARVRVIEGQSGTQDFCFLMSAQRELVGIGISTYVLWAAYLGNATRARIYSITSPERIRAAGHKYDRNRYNFTNQVLANRMSFPFYNSESQDLLDKSSLGKL